MPSFVVDMTLWHLIKSISFLSQKLHQTTGLCLRQLKSLGKAPSKRIGIFLSPQIFLCGFKRISLLSFSTTVSPTLVSSFNFFMALNSPVRHEEALECRAAFWYIFSVSSNYFNNTELRSAAQVIRLDISPRCKEVIKQMSWIFTIGRSVLLRHWLKYIRI